MSKLPSKERIGEMISWTWTVFFFLMGWICVGIIGYGVIFQWVFRLFAPQYTSMHLPVFITLWVSVSTVYYLAKKQKT
jgi:heme/copper-type cytochrome/quinol oxidase subunit 2